MQRAPRVNISTWSAIGWSGLALAACATSEVSAPAVAPSVAATPAAAPAAAPPPPAGSLERLVAIGDLHADLPQALAVLRLAGLVDDAGRWSGGTATLVQTGDTTDRGPDSKEVLELLERLTGEAAAAGGRVVVLLGNHEVMNLMGDWRYVSEGDLADFGGEAPRREAFAEGGALGKYLRGLGIVAVVDGTAFVHGGITPQYAALGEAGLNGLVPAVLSGSAPPDALGDDSPIWFRGYLQGEDPAICADLTKALRSLKARRMVVGHTTQRTGKVATRCGGALLGIDTGISSHYGGHLAAVELKKGDAWAIYPTGAEDLQDP
ncbi:MAG: metallophosphoesterase [Deltaproteobacteria bacterium]|nr:metallophosphoesterase [Deltaproteobacteria bacterium]